MAPKGKWAAGITPRNFCWVIKDRLAICERPGGYSTNHRRVRRQEEIIWIREQGFTCVVSLLASPHNLHNYDELGVTWVHRPFGSSEGAREVMAQLYPELREALAMGAKVILHRNQLDDAVAGLMAGYLVWTGLVPTGPRAISVVEQITHRQLGPVGRSLVGLGLGLPRNLPSDGGAVMAGRRPPAEASEGPDGTTPLPGSVVLPGVGADGGSDGSPEPRRAPSGTDGPPGLDEPAAAPAP